MMSFPRLMVLICREGARLPDQCRRYSAPHNRSQESCATHKYRFSCKCSRRLQGLLNPLETWATYLDSLRCFMFRSESRKPTSTQHLSQNGDLIRHPRREDRPCRMLLAEAVSGTWA